MERKTCIQYRFQKSKRLDEQLKLARKVVDVVDRAKINICVTLLPYILDKPKCSYDRVRIFSKNEGRREFH